MANLIMEILQLRYFKYVAMYNSVSKAADWLHISQPALSNSIKRLEMELGNELFERTSKQMRLTEFGQYYLSLTTQILTLVDEGQRTAGGKGKTCSIAVAMEYYNDRLTYVIDRYAKKNEDISFDIYVSTLAEPFSTSKRDFVFGKAGHGASGHHSLCLNVKSGVNYAVVPRTHRLAACQELSFMDLEGESFTFLTDNKGNLEPLYDSCIAHGLLPKVAMRTNSPAAKLLIMRLGNTVGLIPSAWYNEYVCERNLKLIPLSEDVSIETFFLFYTDEVLHTPYKKAFLEYCKAVLALSESD